MKMYRKHMLLQPCRTSDKYLSNTWFSHVLEFNPYTCEFYYIDTVNETQSFSYETVTILDNMHT